MIARNGIVINGYAHLNPIFRISPFNESHIKENKHRGTASSSKYVFDYFNHLFPEKSILLTPDGRSAISAAIKSLKLKREDCVTIITTTNNFYISSCVTREIEKTCSWSRELNKNTKAIFINHEFGLYCRAVDQYKTLGIPIIEDFAHSFLSLSESSASKTQGNFLICSFSKIFPMQAGGVLLSDREYASDNRGKNEILQYVDSNASFYINALDEIKKKRLFNYEIYLNKFGSVGVEPFFKLSHDDVPGVFCFRLSEDVSAEKLKELMNKNGIESSVFYGRNAYFVPCHQGLSESDIDYIFEIAKYGIGI